MFSAVEVDGPELAVCLACADGEPCAAVKVAGQGRNGSSVKAERNVWGEVNEIGFVGEVIHRTPQELGIAAVIAAKPERPPRGLQIARIEDAKPEQRARGVAAMKKTARERPALQTIRGVDVVMPANASMGSEMIDLLATEREREEGKTMPLPTPDAVKTKILAESAEMPHGEVAEKLGVSYPAVFRIRKEAGVKVRRGVKPGTQPHNAKSKSVSTQLQRVEIDPKRPGTAASLLGALARSDAARAGDEHVTLQLELTHGELAQIVAGLSAVQLAAALRAALTTPRV